MKQKKNRINLCILIVLVLVLGCGILLGIRLFRKGYQAFSTVVCLGECYYEDAGTGYLTIRIEGDGTAWSKTFRVLDEALRERLSGVNAEKIIGVSLLCEIPYRDIQKSGLNTVNLDPIALLLGTDQYDRYFEIVDVHVDG